MDLFELEIAPLIRRPRKPYPRTKHEVDGITRCRDMTICVCWGHVEPLFGGRGSRRGSAIAPLERAMVVSYRLCGNNPVAPLNLSSMF